MGLTALVGLLLANPVHCVPRRADLVPPAGEVFARLGGSALGSAGTCRPGEVPRAGSPEVDPLPPSPGAVPDEEGCRPQGCWAWAGWNDRRRMRGAGARLSIEAPPTSSPDHSLAEVSLQWGDEGQDIVELGWEVAPRRYGDPVPHLFVHRWVEGHACAQCPFQQWSPRLSPGVSLAAWSGAELSVGWLLWQGRAWAWADGEWLGAFDLGPSSRAPAVASVAQWFGEVFFARSPPRVPMGNGRPADEPGAARIREVCDVPDDRLDCVVRPARFPRVTRPELYRLRIDGAGAFRYGGPGEAPGAPLTPRPPPSSASGGTPTATGTSAPSRPR